MENIFLGQPSQKIIDWIKRPSYVVDVQPKVADSGIVIGSGTYKKYTQVTLKAIPNTGFEFVKWSDNITQPERTVLIKDNITLTASFSAISEKRTITVIANDDSLGIVSGSGTYNVGDIVEITATPKTDAKFVKWNDGNIYRIRDIVVNENATYIAYFDTIYGTMTYNARL